MSSIENPGCCTLRPFGGGLLVFDKLLIYPTSLAGPVGIGASSPAVEPTLGGVPAPFAYDLLCLSLCCRGSFIPLLEPSLNTLVSRGVLVVIVTARTSTSLRVVYDVHDCFADHHIINPAPSKGQAWRLR